MVELCVAGGNLQLMILCSGLSVIGVTLRWTVTEPCALSQQAGVVQWMMV